MTHYKLAGIAAHRHEMLNEGNERLVIQVPRSAVLAFAHHLTRQTSGGDVELVLDVEREDMAQPAIGAAEGVQE